MRLPDAVTLFAAPQIDSVAFHDSDAYVLWSSVRRSGRDAIDATARGEPRWSLGRVELRSGAVVTIADGLPGSSLLAADQRGVIMWDHKGPHGAPLMLRSSAGEVWSINGLARSQWGSVGVCGERVIVVRDDELVSVDRTSGAITALASGARPDAICASDLGFAIVVEGVVYVSAFDPVDLRQLDTPDARAATIDRGWLVIELDVAEARAPLGAPFADVLAGGTLSTSPPPRILEVSFTELPAGGWGSALFRRGELVWESGPLAPRTLGDFRHGGVGAMAEFGEHVVLLRLALADEPRCEDRLLRVGP